MKVNDFRPDGDRNISKEGARIGAKGSGHYLQCHRKVSIIIGRRVREIPRRFREVRKLQCPCEAEHC
jgi:hypothetical protein